MSNNEQTKPYRWLIVAAKIIAFLVVAVFIWRAIVKAHGQILDEGLALSEIRPAWLLVAAAMYLVAQLPMAWFWWRTMSHLQQKPRLRDALRAYYIGSLGKYVPGKAMVVVLRTSVVRGPQVDTTVAALCVFIETLTMMAVGGFVGAVLILYRSVTCGETGSSSTIMIYPLAIGLMLATGIPTIPPIFRFAVKTLRVSKANAGINELLKRLDYKLIAQGWLANLIAWPLMGLSLWAAMHAMPGTEETLKGPIEQLPLLTASIALAVVAGFASMLPGGVGVRELVLNVLMVPTFGRLAIVAIILLRLTWLLAELTVSSILYVCDKLVPPS